MEYKRARSEEQKQERVDKIVSVTTELYDEIGYENVTLSNIAEKLSFSRANLYKYFKSKDEIFLKIIIKDTEIFFSDLQETLERIPRNSSYEFAKAFTEVSFKYKRVLHLLVLEACIIQKSVSAEKLLEYSADSTRVMEPLAKSIINYFDDFTIEDVTALIQKITIYARGLFVSENEIDFMFQSDVRDEINSKSCLVESNSYITYMEEFIMLYLEKILKTNKNV